MAEANHSWFEVQKDLNGAPILGRIRGERGRRLAQSRLTCQEVDVCQHIPSQAKPIRFSEEHAMPWGVAGGMHDSEFPQMVAVFQYAIHAARGTGPQPFAQAEHFIVWQHRHKAFRGRRIVSMTSQLGSESLANDLRRPLMIGMAVG
jgi:hypothetical protein